MDVLSKLIMKAYIAMKMPIIGANSIEDIASTINNKNFGQSFLSR